MRHLHPPPYNVFIQAPADLPSGTVTFLMTDVQGSTRLWEARADSMRAAIRRHDAIVQQAIDANGGQLIKERGEGDSHFCVFPNPDDAIRAAIQIQQRLPEEEWETGAPLVVRMSIHSAHAEPHGGDYYGRDVNRCARIRGAAHGGQILVSDATRDSVDGFDFLDLGLHRLMDLSEPQRIYQVVSPDIKREFPPLRSLNAVRHNLPVQLTSFIGREKELEELRKLVMGSRLTSILGLGGAGKTRTALQIAAESVDEVKGGVWFVDLSPITDGSTLGQKVIEDLHVRVGADDPDDAISAHFQGEKTLLLLDNCEHVAHDAAVFTEKLLKKCPNLYVLATSREPLGVSGERSYRLPPMAVKAERTESFDDIIQLDSVRLLLERARAKGSEEVLAQARPQVVLELCKKLDGIPLALEQAAANLGVLSPETMLARLDERLSVLRIDDEGVEARHRTLSAAIDWSYDTLSEAERNLFLDLAVFVGGWTLEAAEAICEQPKVLDLMQRLVTKSLVWPEATQHGDRRFRLLETVREYALEKRPAIPDRIADRHLAYFAHLVEVADTAGLDTEDGRWSRALDGDHPNIIAALNRAIGSEDNRIEGLALSVGAVGYWLRRGYFREGANWLQRAMDAAQDAPNELRGDALNRLGVFAWYQRKFEAARLAYEASLTIWQELGNHSKIGAALNNLATVALDQEDHTQAKQLFQKAVAAFEQVGDDGRLAQALGNIGVLESMEGNLERAIAVAERAVKVHRRIHDREHLGIQITNLLGLYADQGRLREYLDMVEESITLAKEVESPHLTALTLDVIACLAKDCSDAVLGARLAATASRIAAEQDSQVDPQTQAFRDKLTAALQSSLGRQQYRLETKKGTALTVEKALDMADKFVQSL